jgi:hypothetical protein
MESKSVEKALSMLAKASANWQSMAMIPPCSSNITALPRATDVSLTARKPAQIWGGMDR